VAQHPACPSAQLIVLAQDANPAISHEALSNPNCPHSVLWKTARHQPSYRAAVGTNPNCQLSLLRELVHVAGWEEQLAIVNNERCPSDVLETLATRGAWTVREGVAVHPNTPPHVLMHSLADRHQLVRGAVLHHHCLPEEYRVLGLVWHNKGMARRAVGSNQYRTRSQTDVVPATPDLLDAARQESKLATITTVVNQWTATVRPTRGGWSMKLVAPGVRRLSPVLAEDPDDLVQKLMDLEYTTEEGIPDHDKWLAAMKAAVALPGISAATLGRLGRSLYTVWAWAAASSPHASPELLVELCGNNSVVAAEATRNPNCPEALVAMQLSSSLSSIQEAAAENPKCPMDALEQALHLRKTFATTRQCIAGSSRATAEMLDQLAKDEVPIVREAAAANPHCSTDTLLLLLADDIPKVREAASNNPNTPEEYRALAQVTR